MKGGISRVKVVTFILEGLNSVATTLYFFYLFVFMAKVYGFGDRENLILSATYGLLYAVCARGGGRFGQRFGYRTALGLGFGIMALALGAGFLARTLSGHIGSMVVWTFGVCLTWPNLEALVSEKELPVRLPGIVGIYNIVWAATGAVAFFSGGAMIEALGLRSIFWVPIVIHCVQLALLFLERGEGEFRRGAQEGLASRAVALNPRPIARARTFLKLAWMANPFGYVAINTVVAVVPGIAGQMDLTPKWIGFFCSVWFFSRLGMFIILWRWKGWHYNFGWFISAYVTLVFAFGAILLARNVWVIVGAQAVFGAALGLLYYSSLFYSMDAGEAKGEHGGVHEAAIGAGIFGGPAVGAGALALFPEYPHSATLAVSILLVGGFAGVMTIYFRGRPGFISAR